MSDTHAVASALANVYACAAYVLDPGTKSKLLQLDANNQMRSQIRGALFRSIFGGTECPCAIPSLLAFHAVLVCLPPAKLMIVIPSKACM